MWLRICTWIECWKCLFGDLVQDKTSGHKTIFHFRPFETSKCQGKVRLALFFFLLYSAFVTIGPRAEIYQKTARLRNRCDRSICPVNVRHAHLHLNTSLSFFHPLNKLSLDNCYHSRTLSYAGHVARMLTDDQDSAAVASGLEGVSSAKRLPADDEDRMQEKVFYEFGGVDWAIC